MQLIADDPSVCAPVWQAQRFWDRQMHESSRILRPGLETAALIATRVLQERQLHSIGLRTALTFLTENVMQQRQKQS